MYTSAFRHSLLLLVLGAGPVLAALPSTPLRVPPGGPHPEDWFELNSPAQRERLCNLSSSRSTRAHELAALVLQGDEDAYCELALRTRENKQAVSTLFACLGEEPRATLAPLHAYHQLKPDRPSFRDEARFGEPRAHVVLRLRDIYGLEGAEAKRDALHGLMAQEGELHRVELLTIATALEQWCGITGDALLQKRIVQTFIAEFTPDRPVVADSEMECNIAFSYPWLNDFLMAAAGVNGTRSMFTGKPECQAWDFLWHNAGQAINLAEGLGMHAFSLLRMDEAGLARYIDRVKAGEAQVPTPLPRACPGPPHPSVQGLAQLRRLLAEGRRAEAEALAAELECAPSTRTTPACRVARGLLLAAGQEEQAARLRRDALLLAIIRLRAEPQLLYAYVDDLLEHGSKEELALVQRLLLWCHALPFSRAMAERYAELGCHAEAAFCCQALLALAPYAETPPAEDELAALRRLRERSEGLVAGTDSPAGYGGPGASPFTGEMRDWPLKDGGSARGALEAIYPTLGRIRLRQEDGALRELPLGALAGDPSAYFEQWRADNGIRTWHWVPRNNSYRNDERGKLLAAYADMNHPGDYLYTVVDENLNVHRAESWGLRPEERELIAAHYREHGSARPCGDPYIVPTLAEARRLAGEKGLPVVLLFTADEPAAALPNNALRELENQLALHPEDAARWRASMVILPVYHSSAQGSPAAYDEKQLEELRAYERELRPGIEPGQSVVTAATLVRERSYRGQYWACPALGVVRQGPLPPPLPKEPLPAPGSSAMHEF